MIFGMLEIPYDSAAYRIISSSGQALLKVTETILAHFSDDSPHCNPKDFPWINKVENSTSIILSELQEILKKQEDIPYFEDLSEEQKRIVNPQKWKTYFIYAYGHKIKKNALACPQTTQLVEAIPGMTTAFFSILEPHTHISQHRGLYKGVLRYHLGLIIPSNAQNCYLKISDKKYTWEKGKSLVFDDTFPHEAHNDTNERRVVLFVDFKKKFPFPVNILNHSIILLIKQSPFVINGIRKIG